LNETLRAKVGGGYFGYSRTRGNVAFFNGKAKGNTLDAAGNYVYNYKNIELFAELATEVGDWPIRLFVQSVRNTAVSEQDSAYAFGVKLGSAKQAGDAEFAWTFQDIEADAVIGTFNDSDFGGGGADSRGHLIKAKYALRSRIFVAGTLYVNRVDRFQGTAHDYNRIQIDVEFKFR